VANAFNYVFAGARTTGGSGGSATLTVTATQYSGPPQGGRKLDAPVSLTLSFSAAFSVAPPPGGAFVGLVSF
jgi:hypothetical protein